MPSRFLPRKAIRAIRYLLLASAVAAICCWSNACHPTTFAFSKSPASKPPQHSNKVDFAWGSILHRFQNHPRPPRPRRELPWDGGSRELSRRSDGAKTRVLIVTSELAGLHKNGGIGTAFTELATALAGEADIEMSILVAHVEGTFAVKKREALRQELAAKRITLSFVDPEPQPFWPQAWTPTASMRIWHYLRSRDGSYDIIHFPDNTGIGYFSALGKYEGLALQDSRLVVGLHGADVEWAAMLNKRYPSDRYAIELGVFERRTAEMADAVVAPSEYILEYSRSRGWELPEGSAYVIPNIVQTPPLADGASAAGDVVQPINELVFFGRLEERKGTRLLLSTLESLYSSNSSALPSLRITFLGRDQPDVKTRTEVSVLLSSALDSILEHTNASFTYQFLKSYDRDEALTYLQNPSRLALLPSLADNSPSTVLECIAHGIRFIASDVGGVPELVHPDDQDKVLFAPLVDAFSTKLVDTLARLEKAPWTPIRPRPATQTAAADWIHFHRWLDGRPPSVPSLPAGATVESRPLISICVTHYERAYLVPQLLDSLLLQSYTNFEVILVDDGSRSPATLAALDDLELQYFSSLGPSPSPSNITLTFPTPASRPRWQMHRYPNSYLGEARNRAAQHAKGTFLLFLDDDDVLKPHALATLVAVQQRTGSAALSTWLDEFATDVNPLAPRPLAQLRNGTEIPGQLEELPHRRTYWFLGQELSAGMMLNCFGSGNIFVERRAFERIGGFSTYREVGGEDWEFYTRLALQGEKQLVVPEELIFVRSDPSRWSMKFSMDPWDAHFHSAAPLFNDDRIQELGLSHALMLLKGMVTKEGTAPAFADSRDDFQLVQGWGGWNYHFEALPTAEELGEHVWTPSLKPETAGIVDSDVFVMDRNHPRKPFIDDSHQEGWIGSDGKPVAAVRTFRSPKRMDVAIDLSYRSHHKCGDGTQLSLVSVGGPGEEPVVLVSWRTDEDAFSEFVGDASLRAGSLLHLISDPLETDDCDRVEVRLKLTPISLDNKSWSTLAKRAAHEKEVERKVTVQTQTTGAAKWAKVEPTGPNEDEVFNIALIFDRNRYPHAKSVIRSARHFLTSPRQLVFHLITPKELHQELHEFFADDDKMVLRLYDHQLCAYAAKRILPFSNPDIHTSAHCKMFLSQIITFADRVLYLDTDVTVVSDLARCYGAPLSNPGALVSMAVDMGDACQRNPDACWPIGMHWRIPTGLGLQCGNVPSRHDPAHPPASCAEEGELETLQVNGGVAMFEIAKMKEQGFVERYVQSIVHHFRLVGSTKASWGEQDFINSYFRLYPTDLELLPCGCNYQWFGARKEVKCGEQEVSIAHHWSHGIAQRTQDPYNVLFFHFVDNLADAALPPVPSLSPSLPGAPNSSSIAVENSLNCPRQNHDCTPPFTGSEYGQPVVVLTRVVSEVFAADLVDMLDAQTYPAVSQAVAIREGVDMPELASQSDRVDLPADPAEEYALVCERCGDLAEEGASCSTPPQDAARRKQYHDCVCALPDNNAFVMFDLEALANQQAEEGGWILYLDDTQTLVAPDSLSLLMAQVDSPDELVLFRSNTTTSAQDALFRKKILPRSPLDGVNFLFHSSNLDLSAWSMSSRCGRWATLDRLATRLKLKWLDLVPTMEHPLQRHLPATPEEDFKMSVVVLETQGRISWTALLLETLQMPELMTIVGEVVVASVDAHEGAYGPDVRVMNPSVGSGLAELASLVDGEKVLLLSDSVLLDKPALISLLTFHLDAPSRLVGLYTDTDSTGDFALPLVTDPDEFDVFDDPDLLIGAPSWSHLSSRALLTSRVHLDDLSTLLASAAEPFHPVCHPVLLSALSARASNGLAPLRVLPPQQSVVDRIHDCRVRNWPDIAHGRTAGDWAVPATLPDEDEDDEDDELEFDEEGKQIVHEKEHTTPEYDEADFPLPPSLHECVASISALLGEDAAALLVESDEVGVAGPLGVRVGLQKAAEVEAVRWKRTRRMEKCEKT
ncbi:hypothetical protein JCM10207_002731 [Rhodosporidiobolus poonsookiae]